MFVPSFVEFVERWGHIQTTAGYWNSTPTDISMKVLYHVTPSIAFVGLAGILVLLRGKNRKGIFLATYCIFPLGVLLVAAGLGTNVSARYLFFTLPGIVVGASYLCNALIDQVDLNTRVIVMAMSFAIIIPSMQTDYLYFTSGYGHRDRLDEAIELITERRLEGDKVLFLKALSRPKEPVFNLKARARLLGSIFNDDEIIIPKSPRDIDLSKRIWVITIRRDIGGDPKGFLRWIRDHTNLVAEFRANRGPLDNSVKVYLHTAG
jgi:hypothetical protein